MTDAHVDAFLPFVGENLVRLELIDCLVCDDEEGEERENLPTEA